MPRTVSVLLSLQDFVLSHIEPRAKVVHDASVPTLPLCSMFMSLSFLASWPFPTLKTVRDCYIIWQLFA